MDLVIEDEFEHRHSRLLEFGLGDAVVAPTSKDALKFVHLDNIFGWNRIWWDFDLSGMDTSGIVAQVIAEMVFHELVEPSDLPHMIIHTMNPVGRENLKAVFNRWDIEFSEIWL